MAKSRAWLFTLNNYTDVDIQQVTDAATAAEFCVVGKEIAPVTGTPHLQGYIYFKNARALSALTKYVSRAHFISANGTPLQNCIYCKKGGDVLLEIGVLPLQGARSDLEVVRDHVSAGSNMRTLVDIARSYQASKFGEYYLKYHEVQRDFKPIVHWYHGKTGAGKTRLAREWLDTDIHTCMNDCKWFEGYDGHESLLIDDFRKDFAKFHVLLKMLDRYPYRVETKGGSRQLLAKKIAITCPYPPDEVYRTREDVQQLLRRIDQIILVGDPVEPPMRGRAWDDIDQEYV